MHFYLTQKFLIDRPRGLLILVHFVVRLTESLDSTFYSIKVSKLQKAELAYLLILFLAFVTLSLYLDKYSGTV